MRVQQREFSVYLKQVMPLKELLTLKGPPKLQAGDSLIKNLLNNSILIKKNIKHSRKRKF
jgi:hypothetical protein